MALDVGCFRLPARGALLAVLLGAALGCGATYNEARQVDGQTYYVPQQVPNLGERAAHSATHGCKGGVRDDAAALKLVPATDACRRDAFQLSYVVDGIHRVEACTERWRIRCNKTPSTRSTPANPPPVAQEPLDCLVECLVEDHYAVPP